MPVALSPSALVLWLAFLNAKFLTWWNLRWILTDSLKATFNFSNHPRLLLWRISTDNWSDNNHDPLRRVHYSAVYSVCVRMSIRWIRNASTIPSTGWIELGGIWLGSFWSGNKVARRNGRKTLSPSDNVKASPLLRGSSSKQVFFRLAITTRNGQLILPSPMQSPNRMKVKIRKTC